jgi:hypothetical protein
LKKLADQSMDNAVEELVQFNNGSRDIIAGLDCSWAKRGFHSTLGVMTACSPQIRKVLDSIPMSKSCKKCQIDPNAECDCSILGIFI